MIFWKKIIEISYDRYVSNDIILSIIGVFKVVQRMNDSCRSLFQLQNATEFDAEAGIKQVSKTKRNRFNLKCSKFVFKVIFGIMVISVAIGYFMAISRNSNLIRHSDEFDTAYVNNSPIIGKFHTFYTYLFRERFTNKP